ncbi:MAG: glycoside hydrolase family 127 protein [Anaerolineae bacterium]|nr:glycoside hydrolase family 127 protein [Anaerolineae bacterium]
MSTEKRDYPIQPIAFTEVRIDDAFWKPRIDTSVNVTIPYDFQKCEETGRIDNFVKAAGLMDGPHIGRFFNDSDVFKVIEGAAYALQIAPNPELEAYVDDLIEKIEAAQEEDGYLYTDRTIDPVNVQEFVGPERWSFLYMSHELYNVGHMYEAGVAYYLSTGKRRFLDICIKNANLIDAVFGEGKRRDVPGHQEIEIGLVRLYRVTGDERYLKLAKFFLDERGQGNGREIYGPYCQDHLPVTKQTEAVGHAVRAAYMYSGMADVAALTGDADYISAIKTIWENVVGKKLALTGGIGAKHEGESFSENYELPNLTSYNETCASQANIFWNHRLFLLTGDAKYIDVLERTLYNGFLSGIDLGGQLFFYVNPLASDGEYRFNRDNEITRQPWFRTSCCPTNVVRLLPSLSGYVYAVRDNDLYVNLYVAGSGTVDLSSSSIKLTQTTHYPWDGAIKLSVTASEPSRFALKLRIPGWAQSRPLDSDLYTYIDADPALATLSVDGEPVPIEIENGYVTIEREWKETRELVLNLPMPVRRVVAHPEVADLVGKVALERGPVVYAFEHVDNDADVFDTTLSDSAEFEAVHMTDLLGGVTIIRGTSTHNATKIMAIPYYAWGHRGVGKMTVWVHRSED